MSEAVVEMKTPKKAVIDWIDHILDRKKWDGTRLAREAKLAPSTILRLLNDPEHPFIPTLKTLQKIADASGYPIPRKVTEALGAPKMEAPETSEEETSNGTERRSRLRTFQVELRHVSSLPASLQAATTSTRREGTYVPAPAQLENDETAFAFYMPDDSFEPWVKSGSLMFATKRRDPVRNDVLVVTDKNERTKLRLLLGIDEDGLRMLKQFGSEEEERLGFDDIKDIAILVGLIKTI
ncbi:UNVERIFIED_ORG: transcriptional regulator with XRE-family HTH domain [Bradyrhizobium japonicum]